MITLLGMLLVGLLWIDDASKDKQKPCKWGGCNGHYVNNVCNRCGHNLAQLGTRYQ